jgi:hypothetical protein
VCTIIPSPHAIAHDLLRASADRPSSSHKAHPAIGRDGKLVMVAKTGDLDAQLLGSLKDTGSFFDFNLYAVDREFGHAAVYIMLLKWNPLYCLIRATWNINTGNRIYALSD